MSAARQRHRPQAMARIQDRSGPAGAGHRNAGTLTDYEVRSRAASAASAAASITGSGAARPVHSSKLRAPW
jgi:hypothetical protein